MRRKADLDRVDAAAADDEFEKLRAEVTGLRRALESRGLIERAKGVLMQRHGWDAERAFQHLVRLSQHTNVRLAELAAQVVTEAAATPGDALHDETLAYRLLDLLDRPAMMLRPIPSARSSVTDFEVEYANPATVDSEGRTWEQMVGRRLTKLYRPPVVTDMLVTCTRAWETAQPRCQRDAARPPNGSPRRAMRWLVMPVLERLMVTW
jgi:ANTAR domain